MSWRCSCTRHVVPAAWLPIVVSAFVLVGVAWAFARYNGLVRARKRVEEAWSGIDVQLRRRASLLPNLEEIVKGYAAHEREVFTEVARARGALQKPGGAAEAANANETISQAFIRVFAVAENYPQLRASESFIALRNDLSEIEEKIAFARQFYNRNVLDYNTKLDTYPDALIAQQTRMVPAEFFGADEDARAEVRFVFAQPAA